MNNFPFNNDHKPDFDDIVSAGQRKSPTDSALGRALIKDFYNFVSPDDERIVPDKRGCYTIFVKAFINDAMIEDFPLIARDFLKHEFVNLEEYKDFAYADDMPEYSDISMAWIRTMVHAIHTGYMKGSRYCKSLLKYLFKTYHKQLYKSFKKFTSFSYDEIFSLAQSDSGEYIDSYIIAVILCMAEVYEVKLKPGCDALYYFLDEKNKAYEERADVDFLDFPEGHFQECKREIDELFGTDYRYIFKERDKTEKFIWSIMHYNGLPDDFVFRNKPVHFDTIGDLTRTLALLKLTYPKRTFTKEEILTYLVLYDTADALINVTQVSYENMMDTLGLSDGLYFEENEVLFDPDKVEVNMVSAKPHNENSAKTAVHKTVEKEYAQEALLKEIEELRNRLHISEQDVKHLRSRLNDVRKLKEDNEVLAEEVENNRRELSALRSHLYHFTKYDEDIPENEDINKMISDLKTKRITIVGGHTKWVQKIKKTFPDWNYISPDITVSNDGSYIENAEYVYFYTDTISHGVYNTFIQMVRKRNIPFGYIHSVNVDSNIRQMWTELID